MFLLFHLLQEKAKITKGRRGPKIGKLGMLDYYPSKLLCHGVSKCLTSYQGFILDK